MNFRFTVLETSLNRAEFRWKSLRFWRLISMLGISGCLLLLLLGGAILFGWVARQSVALVLFAALGLLLVTALLVILVRVLAATPDRHRLATELEKSDRRLMDRLNTLLFLEQRNGDRKAESFAVRIARQAQGVVDEESSPKPFSLWPSTVFVLGFVVIASFTVAFYAVYSPLRRLQPWRRSDLVAPAPPSPPDLGRVLRNTVEESQSWGEVRITDPGTDLAVTRVDVVPLLIEAAANQGLTDVAWLSALNGTPEVHHELPKPKEPRYAAYRPIVNVSEMNLVDWDVLTYYATARTEPTNSYASQVYFLEVRPFREDLLKLPGGAQGKVYKSISEMSSLIHQQQHVLRQTHAAGASPPAEAAPPSPDRKKLAATEGDLAASTRHLAAKIGAGWEKRPVGEVLASLLEAGRSLEQARIALEHDTLPEAQNQERGALSELIASRKLLQKPANTSPTSFNKPQREDAPSPGTEDRTRLSEIAEFRGDSKAAMEFIQNKLNEQRSLEKQLKAAPKTDYPKLGIQEGRLQKDLDQFQNVHPHAFKGLESQSQRTQQAMSTTTQMLNAQKAEGKAACQQATQELERFSRALQQQLAERLLADAYKLKELLDHRAMELDRSSKPNATTSAEQLQATVEQTKETLRQLKQTAEQEPTGDMFGAPLREALAGQGRAKLDSRLDQLQQARDDMAMRPLAGEARDCLGLVSRAFAVSQPKSLQVAQNADSLKPSEGECLGLGMAELDSLLKQLHSNSINPVDQGKQEKQALFNLQAGIRSQFGDNDRGNQILLRLQDTLRANPPLDAGALKRLLEELQHFSVETSEQAARKQDQPELTNIDPDRLPPVYRGRIQKYFQRLSEK